MKREAPRAWAGALGSAAFVAAYCCTVVWTAGDGRWGWAATAMAGGALVGAAVVLAVRPRGYVGWTVLGASVVAAGVLVWLAGGAWALVACALAGAAGGLVATTGDAAFGSGQRQWAHVLAVVAAELMLVALLAWGRGAGEPEEVAWTEEIPEWPDGGEREDAGVDGDVADAMDASADAFDARPDVGRDVARDRAVRDRPEVLDALDEAAEDGAADSGDGGMRCPGGMVAVPEGDPLLGDGPTRRHVRGFCIDRTEVTVAQYRSWFARQTGAEAPGIEYRECNWNAPPGGRESHPINCVNWHQADAYCRSTGGTLPSDDEWEYAARGTDGREYPWGPTAPSSQLCWRRTDGTCRAGSFPADTSLFGVRDMAGNVWEWTRSGSGSSRSLRGGAWIFTFSGNVRAASRGSLDVSNRSSVVGFRCVRGSR